MFVETILPYIIQPIVFGLIGLYFTWRYQSHQEKLSNDRMLKELFTEFNMRYDALNESLQKIKEDFDTKEKLDSADLNIRQDLFDFFNLCAEEKYWYNKGRIDEDIWKSWEGGMNYWYNSVPSIRETWRERIEEEGIESYYGNQFFKIDENS